MDKQTLVEHLASKAYTTKPTVAELKEAGLQASGAEINEAWKAYQEQNEAVLRDSDDVESEPAEDVADVADVADDTSDSVEDAEDVVEEATDTRVLKYAVRHAKGVYKIGTPISELPEATVKELPKGYF